MSESVDYEKIKDVNRKTKKGIKWILVINILAAPIQLLITLFLGEKSSELLGQYGFLELLLNLVITVGMFGGPNLMIRYVPSISEGNLKKFIFKYIKVSFILFVVLILIWLLLSKALAVNVTAFFGENIPDKKYFILFLAWSILYLLYYILNSCQSALLNLKHFAIASKLYFAVYLIAAVLLYYFGFRGWYLIIYSALVSVFVSLVYTIKNLGLSFVIDSLRTSYKFPKGFWRYSTIMYISTFLAFLYEKIDQFTILKLFDISTLGIYFGVMKIAFIAKMIPQIINRGMISSLSNLVHINARVEVERYYSNIIKINYLLCAVSGLILITFSNYILGYLGEDFANYRVLLLLFIISAFIDFYDTLNSNILIIRGNDKQVLLNTILKNFIFVIVVYALISKIDILALAVARILSLIAGVVFTTIALRNENLKINLSLQSFIVVLIIGIIGFIKIDNILYQLLVFVIVLMFIAVIYRVELVNLYKRYVN